MGTLVGANHMESPVDNAGNTPIPRPRLAPLRRPAYNPPQ
jgi:hypothetical protein